MDYKIKQLYRQVELEHFNKPYNSLAKAISLTLEDYSLTDNLKLEYIKCYVEDYYGELSYVDESEYL